MKDHAPADGRHRMLAKGQELLLARRRALHLARERSEDSPLFCDPGQPPCPNEQDLVTRGQPPANSQQLAAMIAELPDHLGWGSAAQTAVFRATARRQNKHPQNKKEPRALPVLGAEAAQEPSRPSESEEAISAPGAVSLAPSLGLAILRHKKAAPARLWLLLRAIDRDGRGAVPLAVARKAFSDQASPLRFCGPRQLRNLLASGEGIFWVLSDKLIWLRSAARVAQTLNIRRFHGAEIVLPLSALTGGIAAVRANLYAAFHSGRAAKPISRQTLARKSGVQPRTQRHYDRLCGIEKETNYAHGPKVGSEEAIELAWQKGPAAFTWRETKKGRHEGSARFLAWQLPNSYHGPHARLGRGRQKRHNKALADLLNQGTAGNGHGLWDDHGPRSDRSWPEILCRRPRRHSRIRRSGIGCLLARPETRLVALPVVAKQAEQKISGG